MVDCTGLENQKGLIALRGFKSHPFRHCVYSLWLSERMERSVMSPIEPVVMCDGMCEEHENNRTEVHVVMDQPYHDWGCFNYCSVAIEKDVKNGFTVTPVKT